MDRAELNRLIAMVRQEAWRLVRRAPSHVLVDDLIGAGLLGLVDALRRAELQAATSDGYIITRIRGEMRDALRRDDLLTREERKASHVHAAAHRSLCAELEREPSDAELAARMKVPIERLFALKSRWDAHTVEQLDAIDAELDAPSAEEQLDVASDRAAVWRSVDRLPARLALVIRLSYRDGVTMAEIGRRLGVTEARICQLRVEAIDLLRQMFAERDAA